MNRFNLIIANAAALLWASTSFAAGGGHHAEPHIANMWGLGEKYAESPALGWLTITFALFAWGVVRSAKDKAQDELRAPCTDIKVGGWQLWGWHLWGLQLCNGRGVLLDLATATG